MLCCGVGVLIAAGNYIPRRMGTHADPSKAVVTANSGSTASNAATPTPSTPSPADPQTAPDAPSFHFRAIREVSRWVRTEMCL